MFCFPALNIPHVKVDDTKFNTEYANVFVHGLAGWGSYTNQAPAATTDTARIIPPIRLSMSGAPRIR